MKMLQVKSGKSTYRYRLDWIVSWFIVHEPAKGKKPETWRVKFHLLRLETTNWLKMGRLFAGLLTLNLISTTKQTQWPQFQWWTSNAEVTGAAPEKGLSE